MLYSLVQLYHRLGSVLVLPQAGSNGLGFVVLALDQRLARQVVDALGKSQHHLGTATPQRAAPAAPCPGCLRQLTSKHLPTALNTNLTWLSAFCTTPQGQGQLPSTKPSGAPQPPGLTTWDFFPGGNLGSCQPAHAARGASDLCLPPVALDRQKPSARGSYVHVGRVELHVVDPAARWVDPAGAQAVLQRLEGDVQADHQVQLADPVQRLGLPQCPRETCGQRGAG